MFSSSTMSFIGSLVTFITLSLLPSVNTLLPSFNTAWRTESKFFWDLFKSNEAIAIQPVFQIAFQLILFFHFVERNLPVFNSKETNSGKLS